MENYNDIKNFNYGFMDEQESTGEAIKYTGNYLSNSINQLYINNLFKNTSIFLLMLMVYIFLHFIQLLFMKKLFSWKMKVKFI